MKKFLGTVYDRRCVWHNAVFFSVVIAALILCVVVEGGVDDNLEYPLKNVFLQNDQYAVQFSAFLGGQTALEAVPDRALAELENPYDPEQREGISHLYDIAYYNGRYYSYFGIAPIFLVYYPVYFLTGTIASRTLVCLILGFLSVIFVALAYREMVFRFCDGPSLLLTAAGLVGVTAASGVYVALLYSDTYYIPVLSVLACSSAFIYLGFRAMRTQKLVPRAVFLVAAALALTLTVWSRPSVVVMCLMILPLFVGFAVKIRRDTLREGLITIASFVLPLALGAAAVMAYNAARFSSPFDFGTRWQFTVSDISQNKVDLALFIPSLCSFFIQAPDNQKEFPFVIWSHFRFVPFDNSVRYFYNSRSVGAFAFGLPLASLLAPTAADFKRDWVKSATFIAVPLLAVTVAFFDYCIGGVNFRYLLDFLPILSTTSAVLCLGLHEKATGRVRASLALASLLLFGMSVVMCLGVMSGKPA